LRRFLDVIEAEVPVDLDIHHMLENYGAPKPAPIRNWLTKRPRFYFLRICLNIKTKNCMLSVGHEKQIPSRAPQFVNIRQ
jgi:hypothetical protein